MTKEMINKLPDFEFMRKNISYILVYNSEKYPVVPKSENRDRIFSHVRELANREKTLFGIEKFESYLFSEAHTYAQESFREKFIVTMEQQENEMQNIKNTD